MKGKIKWFVFLHIIILMISCSSISSKLAGINMPSIKGLFYYGITICILGVYAIAWQQVIKHLPLITAYANKAVTTIWGLIWGYFLFHEKITPLKLIGAAVVICGVYLVVSGDESADETQKFLEEGADNND